MMEETRTDGASQRVVDRQASIDWFRETRRRTAGMFDLLTEETYYEQPIPLRHPVVFYEGHIPAFSVNTLIKRGLGREGLDEDLERLFARGIDPEDQTSADATAIRSWPTRETVRQLPPTRTRRFSTRSTMPRLSGTMTRCSIAGRRCSR